MSTTTLATGDATAGKDKALTCAGCHGAEGVSVNPDWPHLAGQVPGYISAQLAAFKSGERKNPTMNGFAAGLTEQDMADLDAYYASLTPAKTNSQNITAADDVLELGKNIYKGGIADREIPSCISCHGKSGKGIPKNFPSVVGQHQKYLETQLLSYKKGLRKGYSQIMSNIAFKLTENEINALSEYMSVFCAKPTKLELSTKKFEEGDYACE